MYMYNRSYEYPHQQKESTSASYDHMANKLILTVMDIWNTWHSKHWLPEIKHSGNLIYKKNSPVSKLITDTWIIVLEAVVNKVSQIRCEKTYKVNTNTQKLKDPMKSKKERKRLRQPGKSLHPEKDNVSFWLCGM